MQRMRKWVGTRLGASLGVIAGLLLLTAVTAGQAAEPQTGKAVQQPAPGQQLCPPTPGAGTGTCKVVLDCPTIKTPGKTICQATIDCPEPAKTQEKPKSK